MTSVDYHLEELKIALDESNPHRMLPKIMSSDDIIVDIGCGIGQAFVALNCYNKTCIGFDIDTDAVMYGAKKYGKTINFVVADAANIPLKSKTVDFVFSRVALPYTNIPVATKEMSRILKDDGRIWLTLHTKDMVVKWIKQAIKSRNLKDVIHKVYVLLNGYILAYFGFLVPFVNGKYESWQNLENMQKMLLKKNILTNIIDVNNHAVLEGRVIITSETKII